MTRVIEAESLTVEYEGRTIFSDVSFSLDEGEVLSVLGPNGSGKTTLLRAALGMVPLRRGSVMIFGKRWPAGARAEESVAYLPQRMEFDKTFPITLREMLSLSTGRPAQTKYIDMLELGGLIDRPVGQFSGGQMQRAMLAYAINKEPRLLMMDEPTSWVDAKGADCVLCIMEEFKRKGITMVVVSHDFYALSGIATSVLGLGPDGHFFEPAGGAGLGGRLASLFGASHHAGGARCEVFFGPGGKGEAK